MAPFPKFVVGFPSPIWEMLWSMPDPAPALSSPGTPKRLPVLLRRAWYGLNQTFRQRIAHLGITPDQYIILRWLSEGDPQGLTQRTLTDLMASDPNTITSTLVRMEKNGLIVRAPHEHDKRANRVRILPAGRRAFEKARKVAMTLQEQVLAKLPATRREKFFDELEMVANTCAALLEKTPPKKARA
jgi:DNA-binding MarR family transcriptional regulator